MQRGHKIAEAGALDMPEGFDPCGVPCLEPQHHRRRASTHRRPHRALPGLAPTSMIASVEEVAAKGDGDWLIWGTIADRPVLFAVHPGAGAEMLHAIAAGEHATAIVEPGQLLLERLD